MASDIETVSAIPVYQPGSDWQSLVEQADEILGYDLAKDELADDLVGVPFLITRIVFRPGTMRGKEQQAFVSCEARVADELNLKLINASRSSSELARLDSLDALTFGPESHVVFNDGSTGIYRQIVKYLYMKNYIELQSPIVEVGEYGESSFDQPPSRWLSVLQGEAIQGDDFTGYSANIRLFCRRGLRLSHYKNSYTQTGQTRYLG